MPQKQKVLLLVEDNRDDAELVMSVLKDSDMKAKIVHVKDGAEALDYIFARSEAFKNRDLPHWILLDLKIPKVSGLEVLRALRANAETSKLPVIIFTSSREEADVVEGYRLHVNSFIQKPIDYDEFEEAVKRLNVYWSAMNQYPPTWEKVSSPS